MSADVAVRQNLRLLIDHGVIQPNLATNVESSWGLRLGGATPSGGHTSRDFFALYLR